MNQRKPEIFTMGLIQLLSNELVTAINETIHEHKPEGVEIQGFSFAVQLIHQKEKGLCVGGDAEDVEDLKQTILNKIFMSSQEGRDMVFQTLAAQMLGEALMDEAKEIYARENTH